MSNTKVRIESKIPAALALILSIMLLHHVVYAQMDSSQPKIKVRIKNESRFLITKLIILGRNFENIRPGRLSDYVEVEPFYPSMKVDITIERRRTLRRDLWYHTISYPIDHVGEEIITNERTTISIDILKGEEKGQIEVDKTLIKEP